MKPIVISIDDFKETIKGYDPKKASIFHKESAKLADKMFDKMVRKERPKKVILLSGGSASGKTEYIRTYLTDTYALIFDGTLSTIVGAKTKLSKCKKHKKDIEIHLMLPDNIKRAFSAFLYRDRQFSEEFFYRTHSGSRSTVFWVAENYGAVIIRVIISSYIKKTMLYKEKEFSNRKELVDFLKKVQYNERKIVKLLKR